jgi:hypothetical protein
LTAISSADYRIHTVRIDEDLGLVVTLNKAAASSTSNYLVLLDSAGRLPPNALRWLATGAPAAVNYTDEDHLDEQRVRCKPVFKPD